MKILFPVIDGNAGRMILADGFHNAEYVCIMDSTDKNVEWMDSISINPNSGNLSIALKSKGVGTVITPKMPLMALGLFVDSGIRVLQAKGKSLEKNISLYLDGLLNPYTASQAVGNDSCGSSCSSCSSTCNI